MYSREQLANDFHKLGINAADIVMLHASVRAVGEVAGGPDQIHLALKDMLTADGTLMMPASCPRYYDEVGRGTSQKSTSGKSLKNYLHSTRLRQGRLEITAYWSSS